MEKFEYEEIADDDPTEERSILRRIFTCRSRKGTSWMSAAVLILNAVLAPGMMALPEAFSRAGSIGAGVGLQLMLLVFIFGSLFVLVWYARMTVQATYPDVIRIILGLKAEVCSALIVTVYCYLFCVCSLILIGDQWEKFFSDAYGPSYKDYWYMTRYFLIPITGLLIVLPLCFTKNVEFLTNFSMLGNVAVFYCVVLVMTKYFATKEPKGDFSHSSRPIRDVLSVIPIWCGNYQCHVEVIPIAASLRQRSPKWITLAVVVAISSCATFYTLTGVFGYLTFGPDVNPDLLLEYKSNVDINVAAIAVALKMCMTYPILHFCGRKAIENLWIQAWYLNKEDIDKGETCRRVVISLVTFGIVLCASMIIPNLAIIVPILGSFAAILMFIFPGCCLVQLYLDKTKKCRYAILVSAISMITMGAFVFGFSWADLIVELCTGGGILKTGEDVLEELANRTITNNTFSMITATGNK